ncbi:MAG: hypothetical protein AAAC47_16150 [Pararhizobium sp.]
MARNSALHVPLDDWPTIDPAVFPVDERLWISTRIDAIKLYAEGESMHNIRAKTGITRQEVLRFVNRCQRVAADGRVFGFRALRKGLRVEAYNRRAPLSGIIGDNGKGNAGALQQLFKRFPGAEQFIRDRYWRTKTTHKDQDVRIRVCDLHREWITWLKEQGLKDNEWPLTTINEGLESLRRYCHSLLFTDPERHIAARSGKDAARRSQIGKGIHSIFPMLRPFGAVQLDFHKIDQACIITLVNPLGVEVDVPVARWHIGMMLEEQLQLVIGAILVLELTPSAEATLETIESAIIPIDPSAAAAGLGFGVSRAVLPNQLIDALMGQCFSMLKMDNAWSNIAFCVLESIIRVVGCAVDFGPVRQWWTRQEIEAFFGRMTRSTAQRSPATYGANVADTRRDDPAGKAVHLQIRLSDVLKCLEDEIITRNATRSSANFMGSPMATLEAAMQNPNSTFIPTRLPRSEAEAPTLLRISSRKVIRGNAKKGVRPYIKIGPHMYTNERIAADFSLINRAVRVDQSIRLANDIIAVDAVTGEVLGPLVPPRRLVHSAVSHRMLRVLDKAGRGLRSRESRATRNALQEGAPARKGVRKSASPKPSKTPTVSATEALQMAKAEVKARRDKQQHETAATPAERPASPKGTPGGLFNLDVPVQLETQLRKRQP